MRGESRGLEGQIRINIYDIWNEHKDLFWGFLETSKHVGSIWGGGSKKV